MSINRSFFGLSLLLAGTLSCYGWGQKGHDVVAYVAENHLTPATTQAVDSILNGRSMVYWSNWLDNASHNDEYAYTKTWHYKNIDEGVKYLNAPVNPDGDIVTALREQIKILSSEDTSLDKKNLAIKILVHLMGDLHQPMHMGHASDRGGNKINVRYFGRSSNLHSIWDTALLESAHKWSYTEWQQQIDGLRAEDEALLVSGNIDDWGSKCYDVAKVVYNYFPEGKNVSYDEVADWAPVIEDQLLMGGLRLAHVLNSIFDPAYVNAKIASEF